MARDPSKSGRDDYITPYRFADYAVERGLQILNPPKRSDDILFLEPGCGPYAPFSHAAYERGCNVLAIEKETSSATLDPKLTADMVKSGNFSKIHGLNYFSDNRYFESVKEDGGFHLIITNPPYSLAEKFINRSLELLNPWGVLGLLLRIQFCASKGRVALFKSRPPVEIGVFVRRVSFEHLDESVGGGTDYSEYCMFYWLGDSLDVLYRKHNGGQAPTKFYWIDNSNPKEPIETFGL